MKRFFFLFVVLLLSLTGASSAWAQTATASSGNAGNAIDNNAGTRWESTHGSDDQWWQVDYGTTQTFTGVEIDWEGAYATDFYLRGSNDGENWTLLIEVHGQNSAGTHKYDFDSEKKFRYVRFEGIKRATQYGYSFYEFRLVNESPDAHILKDYENFQFVHTRGAEYWLENYGNFDGTYYYSPTKETRHYIDTEYLRWGDPNVATTKEGLPDPRISKDAIGNYYIENGSTIEHGNVRQRTHWMEHTVWAKPGEDVFLYPFSDFETQGAYLEKFIRWYDYSTDKAAEGLSFNKRHYYSPDFGVISGSGWLGNNRNNFATVAHYKAPESYNSIQDKHIYIACDLSQTGVKNQVLAVSDGRIYEPIIHGRQLFDIRPAAYIADQLSNHNADYIDSVRRKISARAGVRFNVRLDYEMPVQPTSKSPLYYNTGTGVEHVFGYKIHTYKKSGNDLTTDGVPENMFVGDEGLYEYPTVAKYSALMTSLDGKKYYRGIKCDENYAQAGVYVVKIIGCDENGTEIKCSDGSTPLEVMEYEITFLDAKEASFLTEADEALLAKSTPDIYGNHTEDYLKARAKDDFSEAASVTFDTYDNSQFRPHVLPNDYPGEYYKWPVVWRGCSYMYGYDIQRRDAAGNWDGNDFNMYMLTKHSATFACKSAANAYDDSKYAEVMGIAPRQNDSSPRGAKGLYDRTFYTTGGATMGNFFAVNASSDPGRMVDAQIDDLCLGSTLYVSAWVAELSNKNSWGDKVNPNSWANGENDFEPCSETANLIFNFNAVTKQGIKIPLHSFTTGYVNRGNGYSEYMDKLRWDDYGCIQINDWNAGIKKGTGQQGQWMHVYYTFVPDASHLSPEQVANIAYYELSLENNCVSSDGADYGIDDVRVFISKPQVTATQLKPLCDGTTETEVKISADFDTMISSMGKTEAATEDKDEEVYFFYTFLDKDKYFDGEGSAEERFKNALLKYQYLTKNPDGSENSSTSQGYGIAKFHTYYPKNQLYGPNTTSGTIDTWRETDKYEHRYIIFNTHPMDDSMIPGKEYIISICAIDGALTDRDDANFLSSYNFPVEDKCAKRCIFRVHSSGIIKVNGKIVSDQDDILVCDNQYPIVQIDAYGYDGNVVIPVEEQAPFDWYGGSMKEYLDEKIDGTEITLVQALAAFRTQYKVTNFSAENAEVLYGDPSVPADGVYTEQIRQYLIDMTTPKDGKAPKLALFRRSFTMTPGALTASDGLQECYLVAIPVEAEHYIINGDTKDDILICTDPTEIRVYINAHSPHMLHGFPEGPNYPKHMDDVPLRIGLDQLDLRSSTSLANLQAVTGAYAIGNADAAAAAEQTILNAKAEEHGIVLNIPIRLVAPTQERLTDLRRFTVGDTHKAESNFLPEDVLVYLTETNDPEYARLPLDAQPIVPYRYDGADRVDDEFYLPQVGVLLALNAKKDATTNMMRMAFRDDFRFKEGYYYRLLIKYTEEYPDNWNGARTECDGQLIFTLKVVPKYQEWTGAISDDFNNDLNWRRVSSEELYAAKTDATAANGAKRKKVTDGANSNAYSYVPMDFTDVLIPPVETVPVLYGIAPERNMQVAEGGAANGGTDAGYNWPMGSNEEGQTPAMHAATATPYIEYDMAAWNSNLGVNCRPWYANTCEHITFLPNAEIYQQQHLNYQRAWVELEVDKDRWYTLTSPLQKTVAGDMYLPTTTAARQVTEHFLPITYSNLLNDRFRPAVYQRSWDKAGSANVYHLPGDNIITNAAIQAHWSHVFNEVKENYTEGKGFSILTDVSRLDGANDIQKVLFRLPKDDAQYYYHNVDLPTEGYSGTQKGDYTTIDRGTAYTAYNGASVPLQARLNDVNGTITATTQTAGKYFLVGNPLMAHLDMKKFFDANSSKIQPKYWIMTSSMQESVIMTGDGTTVGTGDNSNLGSVAPLQGFFVEAKTAGTSIELSYTADMMKNFDASETRPQLRAPKSRSGVAESGQLRLMLMDNDRMISSATVALQAGASDNYEESEDAILLLDSNLDEQAAVYTVAGETAVSINSLERVSCVPLGIICPDDEAAQKPVILTFDGADIFPQPLYLYDAATGDMTPIEDGMELLLPARSSGQYFITTGIEEMETAAEEGGPAYNLKGIRVANTRNERIVIRNGRKSVVK